MSSALKSRYEQEAAALELLSRAVSKIGTVTTFASICGDSFPKEIMRFNEYLWGYANKDNTYNLFTRDGKLLIKESTRYCSWKILTKDEPILLIETFKVPKGLWCMDSMKHHPIRILSEIADTDNYTNKTPEELRVITKKRKHYASLITEENMKTFSFQGSHRPISGDNFPQYVESYIGHLGASYQTWTVPTHCYVGTVLKKENDYVLVVEHTHKYGVYTLKYIILPVNN